MGPRIIALVATQRSHAVGYSYQKIRKLKHLDWNEPASQEYDSARCIYRRMITRLDQSGMLKLTIIGETILRLDVLFSMQK